MDYEKKLKEALNSNETSFNVKCWIRNHFPELAESEDERIRKGIIMCVKGNMPDNDSRKNYIAWLEKQGEQKPALPKWKYKKDNTPLLRDSLILNKYGCVAKSPSGAIVSDVWVIDYDELAKLPKEELEKQGEQKPAEEYNITGIGSKNAQGKLGEMIKNLKPANEVLEQNPAWGEEDERYLGYAIKSVHKMYVGKDKSSTTDPYVKTADWLKSLKDRCIPQQTEWSEEDGNNLKECLIAVSMSEGHTLDEKEQLENWLKSLRPQNQQYDDEWSDEDKEFLKLTLSNLAELKDRYGEGYGRVGECIKWLNSLQPQPIDVEAVIAYQEGYQKAELEFFQKQQEWTDEDINMIDWLIRCCEKEHEELCNDIYGHQEIVSDLKRDCRKKWDWLESLKNKVVPQNMWKPSDEQIKAVKEAACYSSVFSEKTIDNLISLSKQLKAL